MNNNINNNNDDKNDDDEKSMQMSKWISMLNEHKNNSKMQRARKRKRKRKTTNRWVVLFYPIQGGDEGFQTMMGHIFYRDLMLKIMDISDDFKMLTQAQHQQLTQSSENVCLFAQTLSHVNNDNSNVREHGQEEFMPA